MGLIFKEKLNFIKNKIIKFSSGLNITYGINGNKETFEMK